VRFDYGEPRFVAAGLLDSRLVIVVFVETVRGIRLVSLRKASKREEERYFENFKDFND
jgi:uncharacterized protein